MFKLVLAWLTVFWWLSDGFLVIFKCFLGLAGVRCGVSIDPLPMASNGWSKPISGSLLGMISDHQRSLLEAEKTAD